MQRVLLKFKYDGRDFYGFQKQSGLRTVEDEIVKAIELLTGEKTEVFACSRTDRGVHAMDAALHFDLNKNIPLKSLRLALNNLLPDDISVTKAQKVSNDFNARYDVKQKTYLYKIYCGKYKDALLSSRASFVSFSLDLSKMISASKLLIGEHNFKGFCKSETKVKDYTRTIYDITIKKSGKFYNFQITGNGFLYNMVRIIVGTLIDVGRGALSEDDVKKALSSGQRKYAGKTMPPEGLYLKNTAYTAF